MQHRERLLLMPRRPRRPPSRQQRPRSIKGSHALKPVAGKMKTLIMTSVRATGARARTSMLNIGAADIVRGHMVVHDLGAGSERVGKPPTSSCAAARTIPHTGAGKPGQIAGSNRLFWSTKMFSDEPTVDLDKDDEIIALLADRWPQCFMLAEDRRLPLKVGIFHDLKAALGGKVSPDHLSRALGTYCSAPDYQRRLKDGAARIALDGQRAGTVTPSEAMWARAGGAGRRDKYERAPAVKRSSLADLRAAGARRNATGTHTGWR